MRQVHQCGLAKKLVGLVNVDKHLVVVVGYTGNFNSALDDQVDAGGRLVLTIDHLAFLEIHNVGAGQMQEGVFKCFLRCKHGAPGRHILSSESALRH
jgi:hypothetical protein